MIVFLIGSSQQATAAETGHYRPGCLHDRRYSITEFDFPVFVIISFFHTFPFVCF